MNTATFEQAQADVKHADRSRKQLWGRFNSLCAKLRAHHDPTLEAQAKAMAQRVQAADRAYMTAVETAYAIMRGRQP